MTEEQTPATEPTDPGSQPPVAQPAEPSPEGPAVAAAQPTGPTQPSSEELLQRLQEAEQRRKGLQSALDQARVKAQQEAQQYRQQYEETKSRLDELQMRGMSGPEKEAFLAKREQDRATELQRAVEDERTALESERNYFGWVRYYLDRGVPLERLQGHEDFGSMHQAVLDYYEERATQAAAPPSQQGPPRVGPGDQVHGGGPGVPTTRLWDQKIAEGMKPGTPEFAEYCARLAATGSTELI